MPNKKISDDDKQLMKRYLLWCYKTTKEALDRTDRKFTQLQVDYDVLKYLEKQKAAVPSPIKEQWEKKMAEFQGYIKNKEQDASREKFFDQKETVQPEYLYLSKRMEGIEAAIRKFLGPKELMGIKKLYQEEMTRRILEARDH